MNPQPAPRHRWRSWAGAAVLLAAVLGILALYQQPAFLVMLADQVWACF